jgi:phospholipid-binding lipoprotein MlaA
MPIAPASPDASGLTCRRFAQLLGGRPMRAWLSMVFVVIAVGMAACSGGPRVTASSFDASFDGHQSEMATVIEVVDPAAGRTSAARPSQGMNAGAAMKGRPPRVVRLAAAHAVSVAVEPASISPLNDGEVIEEYDPWAPFNRRMFAFNRQLDRFVLKPVATVWDRTLPDLAQDSIGHFFDNLSMPPRLANNLFQRNIEGVGREMASFFLNLSMGVLGFFDVATELGIAKSDKDTGQTLGIYGVGPGPYLVLPLLPPLTVRDGIGFAVDGAMNPLSYFVPSAANTGRRGVNIVNERASNLERFEGVEEEVLDLYTAVRNAYLQRRQRAIQEGMSQSQSALPGEPGRRAAGVSDAR